MLTIDTGELRSLLQPIIFLRLTKQSAFGGTFTEGVDVAAQYWGGGNVRITRIYAPHHSLLVKAHDLNGAEYPPHVDYMAGGDV